MGIKDDILAYLTTEQELLEQEQEALRTLSPEDKVTRGVLIRPATLLELSDSLYACFKCPDNNSRFRSGDRVVVNPGAIECIVIENNLEDITLQVPDRGHLMLGADYDIEAGDEISFTQEIRRLIEQYEDGVPGVAFLRRISTCEQERQEHPVSIPELLERNAAFPNVYEKARTIAGMAPQMLCIQGPPGSGKTRLLGEIAANLVGQGKILLVIANTHHAVNNALNAIHRQAPAVFTAKIGQRLYRETLAPDIRTFPNLWHLSLPRRRRQTAVIGMTFISALLQIGLAHAHFTPDVVLIDEASQLPLTHAAALGRLGASSVILFGDENQMPPIFRSGLTNDPLSVSIFQHIKMLYPILSITLDRTYRMNQEICKCIKDNFYPEVQLHPANDEVARASFPLTGGSDSPSSSIRKVFNDKHSIQILVSSQEDCGDCNVEEAKLASEIMHEALRLGLPCERMATVTPYRRQVRLIRGMMHDAHVASTAMPLIDTVERLQGQEVDLIILSFCSSDPAHIQLQAGFLFDKNRTNVMISRAKTKVVILVSKSILELNATHWPVCSLLQELYKSRNT